MAATGGSERSLQVSPGLDGAGELYGHLDPAALHHRESRPRRRHHARRRRRTGPHRPPNDAPTPSPTICRHYLDHAHTATTTTSAAGGAPTSTSWSPSPTSNTAPDAPSTATPSTPSTVKSLLCDAGIHRFITDGASITLDAGRTTRTVNHHLFTALALRDQGCRFPGCDRPVTHCEAHHAIPWQHGGETTTQNLVLLCWRHHHDFAHHPQWQLKLLPDATVEVTTADGRILVSRPPPPAGTLSAAAA